MDGRTESRHRYARGARAEKATSFKHCCKNRSESTKTAGSSAAHGTSSALTCDRTDLSCLPSSPIWPNAACVWLIGSQDASRLGWRASSRQCFYELMMSLGSWLCFSRGPEVQCHFSTDKHAVQRGEHDYHHHHHHHHRQQAASTAGLMPGSAPFHHEIPSTRFLPPAAYPASSAVQVVPTPSSILGASTNCMRCRRAHVQHAGETIRCRSLAGDPFSRHPHISLSHRTKPSQRSVVARLRNKLLFRLQRGP